MARKFRKMQEAICPSNDIIVDFLPKPFVYENFFQQRDKIMSNKD